MRKILFFTLAVALLSMGTACRRTGTLDKQTSVPTLNQEDSSSLIFVSGRLIIGHEVRSFIADGDTTEYWIIDETDSLKPLYEKAAGEKAKPYTAVKASLRVVDAGKSAEGFAAEYDGVYRVKEIIEVAPMP